MKQLPISIKQDKIKTTCKQCSSLEEQNVMKSTDSCACLAHRSLSCRIWRCLALPLLLAVPVTLLAFTLLHVASQNSKSLPVRIVSDLSLDLESEHSEPDILRETRTRFVAPLAVRIPRAKRELFIPLQYSQLYNGNVSDDIIEWSSDSGGDPDSEEMEAAGLFDSQELDWEVAAVGTTVSPNEQETTTMNPEDVLEEIQWPGDYEDAATIREMQARRMLQYMDLSADPCDDFYQYSCGKWANRHPIPRDKAGFDTFELLRERLDAQLRTLLEQEPLIKEEPSNAIKKARDLYQSCMDHNSLTSRGSQPLLRLLDSLGGWPALNPNWDSSSFDWIRLMAELRRMNNDILIAQWIGPDIKHSDEYIIQFDQTSLGLPTRDYFLQTSNAPYLQAYRTFMIRVITLMGASSENATISADEIVAFETDIARLTASAEERRNVSALYRRWTLAYLEKQIPGIDWRRYLSLILGYAPSSTEPVVVFAEKYFERLAELIQATPAKTVSNYLIWRFVRHRVGNLDERFQDVRQRFYCALFGREQAPPRWKDCVAQVNANMGMALGALFVQKHFDENSKNDTLYMTQAMQDAFRSLVSGSQWLDDDTKTLSADKVVAMTLRIGYPDFILEENELDSRYETLNISSSAYFENMVSLLRHANREERSRLGSQVNKTQWNTAPAVVNAYYSRNKNQIMFPAGILQPPFYHRHFPRSLNYGGIGVVIGHEITHGFDDKGRLFDRAGNMQRWWPERAIQNFHQRAQCLIDQYSQYTVDEVAMQVDGMNTQGENIADNGGIKQAFLAYQRWLTEHGDTETSMPGINATHLQLFFINFAQVWCGAMRPEATRNKLKTAVHSPGKFRVIGTLSNSEDFASVFQCPRGSPMNPELKCSVW